MQVLRVEHDAFVLVPDGLGCILCRQDWKLSLSVLDRQRAGSLVDAPLPNVSEGVGQRADQAVVSPAVSRPPHAQFSSGNRIVITGSPSSPGPQIAFRVTSFGRRLSFRT